MASTSAGNPFTLTAWFAQDSPDPPLPPTPTPDGVTFSVTAPDRDETDFVFGVDSEVANPATNLFTCTLSADFLDAPGEYRWKAAGTLLGEVTQTLYGTLYATGDATEVSPPSRPPGPVLGPCWAWITGDDVAAASGIPHGSNPGLFDKVAYESMQALYEISGRLFNGICEWAVRPCANENCGCWGGPPSYGFGQAWWTGTPWGTSGGWGWYNERGDRFGCKPMSRVRLAGTVREIVSVHIDGVLLPEYDADTGYRNYRLDNWTDLVRMDTPDGNGSSTPQFWPGCQNLSLDADQPGTFEVLYKWGVDPPEVARTAATELANQLYLSTNAFNVSEAGIAVLPQGVTKIDRQGIIIERQMLVNWMNATERTGLVNLDSFLTAYVHAGKRGGRTPMIWSPDVQQFPRRVGDGTSTAGS
jgi:hypothetical protein